jgi:hypothetical protein
MTELGSAIKPPHEATTHLTLRRAQKFQVAKGVDFKWTLKRDGEVLQSGSMQTDVNGILTIPELTITDVPSQLRIVPGR